MELRKLIEIVDGQLLNDYRDINIKGFSTDTRSLNDDEVYIALKGKNDDGHKYITNDLKASAVISEENLYLKDIPVIKVPNTYNALYCLGKYIKNQYNMPLIAITGSNGKTTLKELIYHILSTKYRVLKNDGNKNNIIGIFHTLQQLENNYDLVVMEMGMNHRGELSLLSKMTKPNTAVITNIGSSHIGNLNGQKNIYKAKMEIVEGLTGQLIVNGDDKYLKNSQSFKCGTHLNNDLIAYNVRVYSEKLTFDIYLDREYQIVFNVPSKDYISTVLEAIKVGLDYEIDIDEIIKQINSFKPFKHRLNFIKMNNYTVIDDCYNASYESMRCGLSVLKNISSKKIIILGDMLELGKYSKKYHKKINKILDKIDNKIVLTVGEYTKYIDARHFKNNQDIIHYLKGLDLCNYYIFIKGSHSMKLEEIVDYLIKS